MSIRIGTAGWSLTAEMKAELPDGGTHLQRYASRFDCVEINSSFYRPHRRTTYERWADSVPNSFRFAVKLPKAVTHERRLRDSEAEVAKFLEESAGLREKLGVYLVQLPPSLQFDRESCRTFFANCSLNTAVPFVLEPRHATWFTEDVDSCLKHLGVGRVAADPAIVSAAGEPGGSPRVQYYRLHGSPQMYYSNYYDDDLRSWHAQMMASDFEDCWCIFDNTAIGAAFHNAGTLKDLDRRERSVKS